MMPIYCEAKRKFTDKISLNAGEKWQKNRNVLYQFRNHGNEEINTIFFLKKRGFKKAYKHILSLTVRLGEENLIC